MNYVAFFGIVVPFQLFVVVIALHLIRRRTFAGEAGSWLRLVGKVLLLMVIVNVISIIPGIGLAAVIVWLVGLKRLSGLDVLPTFILSFSLGIVCFAAMIVVARYLQVSLAGQQLGG